MAEVTPELAAAGRQRRRWVRYLRWVVAGCLALSLAAALLVKEHVRTLASLRRVPGTNAYVMDYYVDYNLDRIRERGIDVHDIEGSLIRVLFPGFAVPLANHWKRAYLPRAIKTVDPLETRHRCSTVALRSSHGDVFFGRNFDWHHDACLILKIRDRDGLASVSVIDLAYLNLNRADLDRTSLIARVPLLFAPYYLMDGMNRRGVAVSDMSVPQAKPPATPGRPEILMSTLMRVILDQAASADEAVALVREFNVHFAEVPVHLMIADAAGQYRIVEFIEGEIRVTAGNEAWQVCTNHLVWNRTEQENRETCGRYRTGADAAGQLAGAVDLDDAMDVALKMAVDDWTMWTSVYNLTQREFRMLYKARPDVQYRDAWDR